jgi:serine/threonine protein kinase
VGNIEYGTIESKGETISGGATGLVERLPSGNIVKSPWSGFRAAECRRDMTTEFQIYERLGPHPRLVKIISWDPENCVLIMEYMPNGSLKDYLCEHNDKVSKSQRLQWAREAAEGLQRLHSANVIHCDVEPKNFLLDSDLGLKIADFSGSSLDGSQPSACAGVRFSEPNFNWRSPPTVRQDLYSLGSTIYNIMTGRPPFQELPSNEVEELYKANTFPELKDILCGGIIQRCWYNKVASAQEIYNAIQIIEMDLTCEIDNHRVRLMLIGNRSMNLYCLKSAIKSPYPRRQRTFGPSRTYTPRPGRDISA